MTDIIVDKEYMWNKLMEAAMELQPSLRKTKESKLWKDYESRLKTQFLETPAVAVPKKDIIFLHGKIPEDYIEMVLTHETLHIAVQKTCGYAKKGAISYDKCVDNPALNSLLCLQFNMNPNKFHKWLVTKLGHSFASRIFLKIIYPFFSATFDLSVKKAEKLWKD